MTFQDRHGLTVAPVVGGGAVAPVLNAHYGRNDLCGHGVIAHASQEGEWISDPVSRANFQASDSSLTGFHPLNHLSIDAPGHMGAGFLPYPELPPRKPVDSRKDRLAHNDALPRRLPLEAKRTDYTELEAQHCPADPKD